MLHFYLAKHAKISSRNGKTNREMFIYVSEGMYFIQSFSIQPRSLVYLLETMESDVEEEIKHIAAMVYRGRGWVIQAIAGGGALERKTPIKYISTSGLGIHIL